MREVEKLIAAACNLRDRLLIRLLFRLGCRVSEVLALKVEGVDFVRGTVAIKHLKARMRLHCPKCGAGLGRCELNRVEFPNIKSQLQQSPSLRRRWDFRPSARRLSQDHIRAVATHGLSGAGRGVSASAARDKRCGLMKDTRAGLRPGPSGRKSPLRGARMAIKPGTWGQGFLLWHRAQAWLGAGLKQRVRIDSQATLLVSR